MATAVQSMSLAELRRLCSRHSISIAGCIDKQDVVNAVLDRARQLPSSSQLNEELNTNSIPSAFSSDNRNTTTTTNT
eukprot:CAMPEP_0174974824 /NCGR_PEP_ID=MMETSP0004_2-20121128/12080_1 /TAXON_ID=420556 /ORGANISM="Ochromonas sp., Strain CCMP1393" /LENGTH=76 /DNA_ID=CAMNT_0016225563 /DNA_START=29 /DNA_END=255 /DNA_ORIENTATION=-